MKKTPIFFLIIFLSIIVNCESQEYLYPYQANGKIGYLNNRYEVMISPVYEAGSSFYSGRALVQKESKYQIINSGGIILKEIEADFANIYEDGFFLIKKNGQWSILNNEGDSIYSTTVSLESLFSTRVSYGNLIRIKTEKGFTYIDSDGEFFADNQYFYNAYNFSNDLAAVRKNQHGKEGFIGPDGNYVIAPQYDFTLSDFSEGFCAVEKDGETFVINKNNKIQFYAEIGKAFPYYEGVMLIANGVPHWPLYSLLDRKGNYIIKDFQAFVMPFSEGLAVFHKKVFNNKSDNFRWGYMNTNGEVVIKPQFTDAKSFHNGLAEVWMYDEQGYIDPKGNVTWIKDIVDE